MSSWRKLMTPVYDKYLPQESTNLTNSQSRLFRNTSVRSTLRVDSVNSSICNDKLQQLQSEMNRLKSELNKYPNSSRTVKTLQSSRSHMNNVNFSIEEDSPAASDEEITTKRNRNGESRDSQKKKVIGSRYSNMQDSYDKIQSEETPIRPVRSNKKPGQKNLMKDYDLYEEEQFSTLVEEMPSTLAGDDNEISMVDHIYEKNDRITASADISPGAMTYIDAKRQAASLKYKDELKTEKPKRKNVEKKSPQEENLEGSGREFKKFFTECHTEISELKEIVLHSKKKIDHLQDELESEKRKAQRLRHELSRQSTLKLPKIDESHDISCLPEVESPIAARKNFHRANSSVRESKKNLSFDIRDSAAGAIFLSGTKSREFVRESNSKLPGSDIFKSFKEKEKNRKSNYLPTPHSFKTEKSIQAGIPTGKESTSSGGASKALRTTAVQCDFFLEKIADFDDEQLEEQKKEIDKLNERVHDLKSSKNKMIETFQDIIEKLAQTKIASTTSKIDEVKEEFGSFYSEFQSKMEDLNKSRYGGDNSIRRDKENSPNRANESTVAYGNNSKNLMKTMLSDGLVYSPSNIGTSFLEGFLESRAQQFNPTIKLESPFLKGTMNNGLTQTVRSFVLSPKQL